MRIGEIIGTVTLHRRHPSLLGASFRLVVPLTLENLVGKKRPDQEAIVVYDDLGGGSGQRMAISEGGEAAQAFHPEVKPIDAYNAALLDSISVKEYD